MEQSQKETGLGWYTMVSVGNHLESVRAFKAVLRVKKHKLTICNAAHGIRYVTLKFVSLPSVAGFVKLS